MKLCVHFTCVHISYYKSITCISHTEDYKCIGVIQNSYSDCVDSLKFSHNVQTIPKDGMRPSNSNECPAFEWMDGTTRREIPKRTRVSVLIDKNNPISATPIFLT